MVRVKEDGQKMRNLIKIFFPSLILLASCGCDRAKDNGKDIVEIDKALSMWTMHQSRSCSSLEGVISTNVESDVFNGSDHLNILRNQRKILSKFLVIENSAAEENFRAWVKCQQEALDELLTQSNEKMTIRYPDDPNRLLDIQEELIKQILARRSTLE